jgi:anti-sigma B factor antagonist
MTAPNRLVMYPIRDALIVVFSEPMVLDALQVQEIGDELYKLVDGRACRKLVLDLSKVQMLSSAALGVLINLKKKSDAIKGKVVLCGIRKEPMKVFQITHLNKVFDIKANEEEALAVFGLTSAG